MRILAVSTNLGQGRPDRSQCVLAGYDYDQVLDQVGPDLVPAVSTFRFLSNGGYGSSVGSLPSDSGSKPSRPAPPQSVWSASFAPEGHRLDKAVRLSLERCEGGLAQRQSCGFIHWSASASTIGRLYRFEARNYPGPGGPVFEVDNRCFVGRTLVSKRFSAVLLLATPNLHPISIAFWSAPPLTAWLFGRSVDCSASGPD